MGTVSTGNPITLDATGTLTGTYYVRLIQWVDDANNVANDQDLTLVINGVTLLVSVQAIASVSPVVWQIGPFNPGIPMKDITATIANGAVHIWID